MKRNDVVFVRSFYGRINRKIDEENYEIVDCGGHFESRHISEFELTKDYKGYWTYYTPDIPEWRYDCIQKKYHVPDVDEYGVDWGYVHVPYVVWPQHFVEYEEGCIDSTYKRFVKMPSLRKLKQNASRYNKKVWKHNRD